jgi:CheY-like chemotaxis protein
MPRKDGITLIKDVRQQELTLHAQRHLPIVVMSGGGEEKLRDAAKVGAAFCFSKPFLDLAKVVDKIKELLHTPLIMGSAYGTI